MAGARWVQSDVLASHRSTQLQVDVVWMPMLPGDSRQWIDQRALSDPRVTYFWDPNRLVGTWFARHIDDSPGVAWDVYYLFGADARWDATPGAVLSSGGSVIGSREDLLAAINHL